MKTGLNSSGAAPRLGRSLALPHRNLLDTVGRGSCRAAQGGDFPLARGRSRLAAFTMIEIALALGIIGFALVAIIGILPAGLNVQRESRQDTIIGQDGPFFLETIRDGAPPVLTNGVFQIYNNGVFPSVILGRSTSLDFLTNYVDAIWVSPINGGNSLLYPPLAYTNGTMILGLLCTPGVITTAKMRGFTGAATEQDGSNAIVAFHYYMDVEVEPYNPIDSASVDANNFSTNEAISLNQNLYDIRLRFRWPAKFAPVGPSPGAAGTGRQSLQSMVSAHMAVITNNGFAYYFLQPQIYSISTNGL